VKSLPLPIPICGGGSYWCFGAFAPDSVGESIVFGLSASAAFVRLLVRSSGQILLPRYLISWTAWAISTKHTRNIHVAPPLWRLKVKGQGHNRPSIWRRHPLRRSVVEIHLLVLQCMPYMKARYTQSQFCLHYVCRSVSALNIFSP